MASCSMEEARGGGCAIYPSPPPPSAAQPIAAAPSPSPSEDTCQSGESGACKIQWKTRRNAPSPSSSPAALANGHGASQEEEEREAEECTEEGCALVSVEPIDPRLGAPLRLINSQLTLKSPEEIILWAKEKYGDGLILTTSFGIQSAVMLHMVTRLIPNIPVVWVDTGFLPKETYVFAQELIERLNLNIKVYQPQLSAARLEALYGKLWEAEAPEMHELYGTITKVEPMNRAIEELNATAVFTGLRAKQTDLRKKMQIVNKTKGKEHKVCPILSWTEKDVDEYLSRHNLPYHPLKAQGYETVGDAHSSRPVREGETDVRATRFNGRAQECGLHLNVDAADAEKAGEEKQGKNNVDLAHIERAQSIPGLVLYTQPNCKFCKASKLHLKNLQIAFSEFGVGDEVSVETLIARIGRTVTTVPQIFIDGEYLGGYKELVQRFPAEKEEKEDA